MEIAASAMGVLIPKLASLLQQKSRLHRPVKQEIEQLKQELENLKADVLHGLEIGVHLPAADDLSRKLLELSYDIEDSVDKFMQQRVTYKRGRLRMPVFLKKLAARRQIAKRIGSFKSRVKKLSVRYHEAYNINHDASSSRVQESKKRTRSGVTVNPPSSDAASTLVGMDRPREELITKLQLLPEKEEMQQEEEEEEEELEPEARLKVLSIVGVGGIGKTALAKEVYEKVKTSFPCRAWVSISRNSNMENILMGLLRQVEDDPHNSVDADGGDVRDLIRRIKKCLQGKRFLLVLDDILSTNTWEVIELALPLDSCGSRVITTTRNYDVAAACSSDWNGYIYQVIPLSSKDAWMLFRKGIIGSTGTFPSHLDDVSDKILEICSGVPLAIITMSGLLANKPTSEEACRYISAIPVLPIEEISNILLLSYNDLPDHLKVCFLYLSIFPEDYPINYAHIIRCWIAEGFIMENDPRIPEEERNPNRNPEEVGRSYLNELINRRMIQPVHGGSNGKSEYFRIHSLILDLIRYISSRNDFVTLLNNEMLPSVLHNKVGRLSIVNGYHDITPSMDISHIRSLHIIGGIGMKITFKNLRFLRVLNLEGCKDLQDDIINKEIPGLLGLRYLSIRATPASELPNEIELQSQGIQLNSSCYLCQIPESLLSLPNLRYLSIDIEEVRNEDLRLLSKLCFLLHLSLFSKIVPTEKLVISSKGFEALRVFHLYSARTDLIFEPQAMHNLEELLLSVSVRPGVGFSFNEDEEIFGLSIGQYKFLKKSCIIFLEPQTKKIDIRINGKGEYASKLYEAANDSVKEPAEKRRNSPKEQEMELN